MPGLTLSIENAYPILLIAQQAPSSGVHISGPASGAAYMVTSADFCCSGAASNGLTWQYTPNGGTLENLLQWAPGSTQPSQYTWQGVLFLEHGGQWQWVNTGTSTMNVTIWGLLIPSPLTG